MEKEEKQRTRALTKFQFWRGFKKIIIKAENINQARILFAKLINK